MYLLGSLLLACSASAYRRTCSTKACGKIVLEKVSVSALGDASELGSGISAEHNADDQADEIQDPSMFTTPMPAPVIWDTFWTRVESPPPINRLFLDSKQESTGVVHKFSDRAPSLGVILDAFLHPKGLSKNAGISGASMYLSEDAEYIVKKLTPLQTKYAHKFREAFSTARPANLLVPIYYLFERCKLTSNTTWRGCDSWMVNPTVHMANADEYDLKGGNTFMNVIFRAEDGVFKKMYPKGLELTEEHLKQLDEMMAESEAWLSNIQVFDYSLLLEIGKESVSQNIVGERNTNTTTGMQNGPCTGAVGPATFIVTVPGSTEERCVSMGIIDYLGNRGQGKLRKLQSAGWESRNYAKTFRGNIVQRRPFTCPCDKDPCPYFHKKSCEPPPKKTWKQAMIG